MNIASISQALASQGVKHVMVTANADITRLKSDSVVRVFHGTQNMDSGIRAFLKSGIDGTKVVNRSYNQGNERGLYVAPDQRTARTFGNLVLEFDVKAKDLYPTARWGLGAGHRNKNVQEMAAERFPDSFRPLVSWQLTEKQEPQAMFLGFVPVSKIIAVHVYPVSSNQASETLTVDEARTRFGIHEAAKFDGTESYQEVLEGLAGAWQGSVDDIIDALKYADDSEVLRLLTNSGCSRKQALRVLQAKRKDPRMKA